MPTYVENSVCEKWRADLEEHRIRSQNGDRYSDKCDVVLQSNHVFPVYGSCSSLVDEGEAQPLCWT